ncbi:hypothetical protein PPL_09675 [Heterostelium album PN500]|uniref:Uncharacterized protein n=1 Tax=Heterostelium pallidum (strain ATCC 26659 / Pp 5 / PN500) TaxID=670386 RepID=D3BNH2_HETP5|nr:hypothetical protein PPL_09675 [Heterostelium album PN500]EFA76923.1 hypothetical protein PPL_09675 [Heterostelium album PN500]|eukprot:XP_020429055.1 hypothetical protein PPL_09675 [Heterostelium album PN500]
MNELVDTKDLLIPNYVYSPLFHTNSFLQAEIELNEGNMLSDNIPDDAKKILQSLDIKDTTAFYSYTHSTSIYYNNQNIIDSLKWWHDQRDSNPI